MTDLYYTHAFEDLDSELVWDVYYDEKPQQAHVNLQDIIYTYDNVPFAAVEALVQASSIGREFNGTLFGVKGFKRTFGPGTKHGYTESVTFREREKAVATRFAEGGYVSAPAGNSAFPGVVPKNLTVNPNASSTGKTVPLKTDVASTNAALESQKPKGTYTVHFESDYRGSKTYTTETVSVDAAVAELLDVTKRLGLSVKVTGVFVHLG